jgi:hypothetical protein
MKNCCHCKEQKPKSEFYVDRRANGGLNSRCKKCLDGQRVERKDAHKYFMKHRAKCLMDTAKKRARKKGLPYDLDKYRLEIQQRIDKGVCEVSGFPLNINGGRTFDSPSLDRIDPSKGYVYENIRIICDLMNMALSDWGEEILYAVITSWLRKRQGASDAGETFGEPQEVVGGDRNPTVQAYLEG